MEIKYTGQYLFAFRWQWENEFKKTELMWEAMGWQNEKLRSVLVGCGKL